MKPYLHAKISVKRHGGVPSDYLPIHDFIDSSKITTTDHRHRAILHNSFGIYLAEKVFGNTITNSDNKVVSVRQIAEEHIFEDLGRIPTVSDWVENIVEKPWMNRKAYNNRKVI